MFIRLKISVVVFTTLVFVLVHLPRVHTSPLQVASASHPWGEDPLSIIEEGKLGAVASESAICSHHGTEMLKKGGNAADAVRGSLGLPLAYRRPLSDNPY
jgi:gamma-glutamyltranspeptidase/glutathione hydrolase